jgi:hypothetical protein
MVELVEDPALEVADISERLDRVVLRTVDMAGRAHLVTVMLVPADYLRSLPGQPAGGTRAGGVGPRGGWWPGAGAVAVYSGGGAWRL